MPGMNSTEIGRFLEWILQEIERRAEARREVESKPDPIAQKFPGLEGLLTTEEAAELLGVTQAGIYQMVARREIPFIKIGRRVRFKPSDLKALIEESRVEPMQPLGPDGRPLRKKRPIRR